MLDNQFVGKKIQFFETLATHNIEKNIPTDSETISDILVDAFQSAAERDLYTGDSVEVIVLKKGAEPVKNVFKIRAD